MLADCCVSDLGRLQFSNFDLEIPKKINASLKDKDV